MPPDQVEELEKQIIRVEDVRPEDLLASTAAIEAAARATQGLRSTAPKD